MAGCSEAICFATPVSRAGPVNAITLKNIQPGCHVIAKLIFVTFNRYAEIIGKSGQLG